jgi:hypothetical protein
MRTTNHQSYSGIELDEGQGACERGTNEEPVCPLQVDLNLTASDLLRAGMDDLLVALYSGSCTVGALSHTEDLPIHRTMYILEELAIHGYAESHHVSGSGLWTLDTPWRITPAGRESLELYGVALGSRRALSGIVCSTPCRECGSTGVNPAYRDWLALPAGQDVWAHHAQSIEPVCMGCAGSGLLSYRQSDTAEVATWAARHGRMVEVDTEVESMTGLPDVVSGVYLYVLPPAPSERPGHGVFYSRPVHAVKWGHVVAVRPVPAV